MLRIIIGFLLGQTQHNFYKPKQFENVKEYIPPKKLLLSESSVRLANLMSIKVKSRGSYTNIEANYEIRRREVDILQ